MDRSTTKCAWGSSGDTDLAGFGLDRDDSDRWIEELRAAQSPATVGTVGDYELVEEVARGGQGIVWRARQPGTKRQIAIKRLLAGQFATAAMRRRFEREVEAAAALNHRNIVTIYGFDVVDDQPLLAMEWIDGVAVTDWAAGSGSERRSVDEILRVFLLICDAVQHAHQHGVIHRDLKPSNVLVDKNDQPRVLDFGLAKLVGASAVARSTQTAGFVGTLAYAAPEQVSPTPGGIDVRTDVYALGLILYEMLSGQSPYAGATDLAGLLEAVQHVVPRRPSQMDRRIGSELDIVILKALAKDPQQRYQSVDAFAADLRRYQAGEPILAHPPSAMYQLRKLVRRHKLPFALAGLLALVLVAGVIATTWQAVVARDERRTAQSERDRARLAENQAERRRAEAETVTDLLQSVFRAADPLTLHGRNYTVRQLLDDSVARLTPSLHDQPEVEATIRGTIGVAYFNLGEYGLAEPHLRAALDIREQLAPADPQRLAGSLRRWGLLLMEKGDHAGAERALREALGLLDSGADRSADCAEVAACLDCLSLVLTRRGAYDAAEPLLRGALAEYRSQPGNGSLCVATGLTSLGALLKAKGDPAAAEPLFQEALALRRQHLEPRHSDVAVSIDSLARLFHDLGRFAESESLYHEALELRQETYGERHPVVARTLVSLAWLLHSQARYDEAEQLDRRALSIQRQLLGDDHPDVANTMNNLALVLKDAGDAAAAEPLMRDALAIRRAFFGEKHPEVAVSLNSLATLLHAGGKPAEAESYYREALAVQRELFGNQHPDVAISAHNLAALLRERGRYTEAEPLYREALDIWRRAYGDQHATVATGLTSLALTLTAERDFAGAEPLYREALAIQRELLSDRHPDVARTEQSLAGLLKSTGRYDEAEALLCDALAILRERLGNEHRNVAVVLNDIGKLLKDQGRLEEAEPLYREAVEVSRRRLGEDHPLTATFVNNLAGTLSTKGKYAEAEALFREALAMRRRGEQHDLVSVSGSLEGLGRALLAQGRFDDAEPLLRECLEIRQARLPPRHELKLRALHNLIRLYEEWDKPDQAAQYRSELETAEWDASRTDPSP